MLELEPTSPAARECLFRAFVNTNDFAGAVNIARERMKQWEAKPDEIKRLDGDPKEVIENWSRRALDDIKTADDKGDKVWIMYGAWLAARLGDKDQAFKWLDKAVDEHASFVLYLETDPAWDGLRSDPRFALLNAKIAAL